MTWAFRHSQHIVSQFTTSQNIAYVNHRFSIGQAIPPHSTQRRPAHCQRDCCSLFPLHCWCLSSYNVPLHLPQRFLNLSLWKQTKVYGTKRPPLHLPPPHSDQQPSAFSVARASQATATAIIRATKSPERQAKGTFASAESSQAHWHICGHHRTHTCLHGCRPTQSHATC